MLPTAGHYPQREKPEQVEKIIRLALDGEVPSPEEENQWMISIVPTGMMKMRFMLAVPTSARCSFLEPLNIARMDTLSRMRIPEKKSL
ncbi:MAG: hypothetical protein Ct9H90mP25_3780 [Gammaproteobacteria bacterium]|nr:MAG: hypothetical protein Ct9H90mP25_3780 [Gammaproteobacteria bacterium]